MHMRIVNSTRTLCEVHGQPGCEAYRCYHVITIMIWVYALVINVCAFLVSLQCAMCPLDGAYECAENAGENGIPATEADCLPRDPNDNELCAECYSGFTLVGERWAKKCVRNDCYCNNGIAAEGSECLAFNSHICARCIEGFTLDIKRDGERVCYNNDNCPCENGTPACRYPGDTFCSACNEGYHEIIITTVVEDNGLTVTNTERTGRCQPNACTCSHGTPTDKCTEHGAEECASCKAGYSLVQQGTQTVCQKICDIGYHLDAETGTCKQNICPCAHGELHFVGETCPTHGEEKCYSCHAGFYLDRSTGLCTACPANTEQTSNTFRGFACLCVDGYARDASGTQDLFISEYGIGEQSADANELWMELYNPTDRSIFVDEYALASVVDEPNVRGVPEQWLPLYSPLHWLRKTIILLSLDAKEL